MISKAKLSYIRSLALKKYRDKDGVFVAEGPKIVEEMMNEAVIRTVVASKQWIAENRRRLKRLGCEVIEVNYDELRHTSFLKNPQMVLAVVEKKDEAIDLSQIQNELTIALDDVQDPGNMGTIIRLADWFGIGTMICSKDCVDVYNPKVVQATMGSIARVKVFYADLPELFSQLPSDFPIYGTLLDGDNIYEQSLSDRGIIVMGNEGNGISEEVRAKVNRRLLIPHFSHGDTTAESLNVAIATAVVCSEFRRTNKKLLI